MSINDDIFDIEIPPPLWQFDQKPTSADDFLSGADRIFSDRDYRRAKQTYRRLIKRLKRAKVFKQLRRLADVKARSDELKVEFDRLKKRHATAESPDDKKALFIEGKQVRAQNLELKSEYESILINIAPYRDMLAKATTLRRDIQQHQDYLADEALKKRLYAQMEIEANLNAEFVIRRWAQLGYVYEYTHKGKTKRAYPKIERIVIKPDSAQYKIYSSRLGLFSGTVDMMPRGVKVYDLIKPDTLIEIESAVKRPVSSPHFPDDGSKGADFSNGAWFVISRLGVRDGLLEKVPYGAVMGRYPDDEHEKIPLPMGVKEGRIINWVLMAKQPHLMATGQTGSGKSNLMNMIVCTIIANQKPSDARIILIDLKEGVELRKFASVPHVIGGLIDNVGDTLAMLEKVEKLRIERGKLIGTIAHDIDSYNAKVPHHERLARIILFFDEYGALAIDKESKRAIDKIMAQLAMKGRSSGIHIVIGVQTPYNDIVPNIVKANITITLEGRQRFRGASMSSSGDSTATELPKIPGRMWCNDGNDRYMVQIPYISDDEITTSINIANQNPTPPQLFADDEDTQPYQVIKKVSHEDIIAYVISSGGALNINNTFKRFSDNGLSRRDVASMLKEIIEAGAVIFEGTSYTVKPYGKGYKLVEKPQSDISKSGLSGLSGITEGDEHETI